MGNTDYLFAMPSFLSGMGRVLNLGGVHTDYNQNLTPQEADRKALASDFKAVGDDIRTAMRACDAGK